MKNFLFFVILLPLYVFPFTLMIDPAGDAKDVGRSIGDSFERGLTLQCAEALKRKIQEENPEVKVLLSRAPGEVTESFHPANFANRLGVDIFIRIQLYHETAVKPGLFIYYYVANPITDFWDSKTDSVSFIPYDKAHKSSIKRTQLIANNFYESMKIHEKRFALYKPIGMPFKPLIGLTMPALGIEIGCKDPQDWKGYITPLAEALQWLIK